MALTFVHLSDIHFQKRSGNEYYLDEDLRNELERDLVVVAARIKDIIQGILITGDIAFSGKKEEYIKAKIWLKNLCQKIQCDEKNVWMVPGNHDVDRDIIQNNKELRDFRSHLRSKALSLPEKEKALRATLSDKINAGIIFKPMVQYCLVADEYGCSIFPDRPFWEEDFEIGDNLRLRLRGLTSTIISDDHDNNQENKLLLGQAQATLKEEDGVAYMILCHHPPDWLMDKEKTEHSLNLRTRIQLFGHKHNQNFSYIHYNNKNKTLKLVAGAVHPDRNETRWTPRYNVISLEGKKSSASPLIRLYPRVWNEDSMEFVKDPLCGYDEFIEYPPAELEFDPAKNTLTVFEEDLQGQHLILKTNSRLVTIGRSPYSDIVLPENTVSREHGMIIYKNEGYTYRHLSKVNRSIVVQQSGKTSKLREIGKECSIWNNSRIAIGPRKLVFYMNISANAFPMPLTEKEQEDI